MISKVAIISQGQVARAPDTTEKTTNVNFSGVVISHFILLGCHHVSRDWLVVLCSRIAFEAANVASMNVTLR